MIWSIDGIEWNIPCTVDRTAEMTASEISGLLLNKAYFNDVIGTYMKYDLRIAVPFGYESEYNALYEKITEPVDGHQFVVPYGGGIINVTGRVHDIKDIYVKTVNGLHWKGISFSVTSNAPTKEYTLSQILTRGATPLPDTSAVNVGDVYEYTASGWDTIDDAEDSYW